MTKMTSLLSTRSSETRGRDVPKRWTPSSPEAQCTLQAQATMRPTPLIPLQPVDLSTLLQLPLLLLQPSPPSLLLLRLPLRSHLHESPANRDDRTATDTVRGTTTETDATESTTAMETGAVDETGNGTGNEKENTDVTAIEIEIDTDENMKTTAESLVVIVIVTESTSPVPNAIVEIDPSSFFFLCLLFFTNNL